MEIALIVIAALVVVALAMLLKPKNKTKPPARHRPGPKAAAAKKVAEQEPLSPWRAVSIEPGPEACEGALALAGKTYLVGEAPTLPVLGCQSAACRCKYAHHGDRRSGDNDRRAPFGLQSDLHGVNGSDEERRSRRGRRSDDLVATKV